MRDLAKVIVSPKELDNVPARGHLILHRTHELIYLRAVLILETSGSIGSTSARYI